MAHWTIEAPTSLDFDDVTGLRVRLLSGSVAVLATDGKPSLEVASATGWQRHTVRGVFSGTLKNKLGLTLASATEERGRVYRIATAANP